MIKRFVSAVVVLALTVSLCCPIAVSAATKKTVLNVYNWGEYIDLETLELFEDAYPDIKVNYTTYDSNESMYSKIVSGAASYDIVIPSDYMISKLIEEDMLAELNFDNIPNFKNVSENLKGKSYDPENKYSVPYFWNTVVLIYNTAFVDEEDVKEQSWDLLWNESYKGKILMFDNPRDAFGIALTKLGYSMNSENPEEWKAAADLLNQQKPLVQAYVMDAIFDKMETAEAWIAPYYAGDALIIQNENEDIDFYMPQEGTNLFFDAMCVLKTSENKEAAEKFINFMCEPEIAAMNSETVGYATPIEPALELLDDELTSNPLIYPDEAYLDKNTEVFRNLSQKTQQLQSALWTSLKIESAEKEDEALLSGVDVFCIVTAAVGAVSAVYFFVRNKKRKELWKS